MHVCVCRFGDVATYIFASALMNSYYMPALEIDQPPRAITEAVYTTVIAHAYLLGVWLWCIRIYARDYYTVLRGRDVYTILCGPAFCRTSSAV